MYLMVEWIHNFHDEPIRIYSELDIESNEIRKIEIYRDGSFGFASLGKEYGGSRLSECRLPTIEEIASDNQFKPKEISKEEFEYIWQSKMREIKYE